MKKIIVVICLMGLFLFGMSVSAEESSFIVLDVISQTEVSQHRTLTEARQSYERYKDNYEELAIIKDDQVLVVEYGVLAIPTGACDTNYEFTNAITNESGYTNGCYGADALYLDTNASGTRVQFMISGAIGWGSLDNAKIIPLSQMDQFSSYVVLNGRLYHQVKNNLSSDKYASLIDLSEAPAYLEEDQIYLSYDGHYFYLLQDFKVMSDDVRNGKYSAAVNADNPYFNYYQYVSHRTMTEATPEQIKSTFQETFKISSSIFVYNDQDKDSSHDVLTQSQYYGEEQIFFQYQNQFGANALMMLALSMNESATGRSSLSFTRNNLFGHAAYDSDVEKNASRYLNVENSVFSHAKNYISGSYLNPEKFQYHGGYFGNKASGMNVSYASDPYWGEKAAQFYSRLDEALGYVDLNSQCLAIKTSAENIAIQNEANEVLYRSGINPNMSFVLLEEVGDRYKIQLDPALYPLEGNEAENTYDFQKNVGYILKSDVQHILNEERMHENELVTVTFDAQMGNFNDGSTIVSYQVKQGSLPSCEAPVKENAVFVGWDEPLESVMQDKTWIAQYREISALTMETLPPTTMEYNDRIDLSGGSIRVTYQDQETEIIPLTTSMVSGYNTKQEGKQTVTVRYGGATTSYPLEVLMELDTIRNEITAEITDIIETMAMKTEFSDAELERLAALKAKMEKYMFPYMTFTTLRSLDQIYYQATMNQLFTVIEKNPVNLAVSGLHVSVTSKTAFERAWIKDTIRISYQENEGDAAAALMDAVALANGYTVQEHFTLSGKMNFDSLNLNDYILVSMDIPEEIAANQIITVLQYQQSHVVKLATQQTANKLIFKTNELGSYAIVYRNSTNTYQNADLGETNAFENNGFNLFAVMSTLPWILLTVLLAGIILILMLKKQLKRSK